MVGYDWLAYGDNMDGYDWLAYGIPRFDNVENVERYTRGGFHPVHLGDVLNGKYTIIHKLGFGGLSTVWLARDKNGKLVAVKVNMANNTAEGISGDENEGLKYLKVAMKLSRIQNHAKNLIDLPIEQFQVTGPNGTHTCIVSHVAGPSLEQLTNQKKGLSGPQAQMAALQVTQCLVLMHSELLGLCHGDLTSSNILLDIGNLDTWTDEKLYKRLGRPEKDPVRTFRGNPLPDSAPRYLVEAVDLTQLVPKYFTGNIRVIDFGESFFLSDGIPSPRGTVYRFCPPEALLKDTFGRESDIWALACVIFELRSRVMLFEPGFGSPGKALSHMIELLGGLPPEFEYPAVITNGIEEEEISEELTLRGRIEQIEEIKPSENGTKVLKFFTRGKKKRYSSSYLERFPHLWMLREYIKEQATRLSPIDPPVMISAEEVEDLHDLLNNMLDYDVKKRMTAVEMLGQPWFSRNYGR